MIKMHKTHAKKKTKVNTVSILGRQLGSDHKERDLFLPTLKMD